MTHMWIRICSWFLLSVLTLDRVLAFPSSIVRKQQVYPSFILSPCWKSIQSSNGNIVDRSRIVLHGWLQDFFEPSKSSTSSTTTSREQQYPEQYPATYEKNEVRIEEDGHHEEFRIIRPLLKNTQLEARPLKIAYDANRDGWNPQSFHLAVDGKGAAIVLAKTKDGIGHWCGGYNPKGWASLGGARPSVAAFLFYEQQLSPSSTIATNECFPFQKLQKVGGGGLACANDDPNFGISFGPDGLVIGLQLGREQLAQSKLGPYYERGPENRSSLWEGGSAVHLEDLKVIVGVYEPGEDIPYSGGVLDMTSG